MSNWNVTYLNVWLLEMLSILWVQVRLSKERKKGDKIVSDSQERAFWRVYRPPPGCLSSLEVTPVPTRFHPGLSRPPSRKRTLTDLQREVNKLFFLSCLLFFFLLFSLVLVQLFSLTVSFNDILFRILQLYIYTYACILLKIFYILIKMESVKAI